MRFTSLKTLAALTALTAAVFSPSLEAAPPLSTIRDVIYRANGSRFTGKVIVEWRSFEASDTSFIGRNRLELPVTDGLLDTRLVPTTTANSAAYYIVKYVSSSGTVEFVEAWAVPPSDTGLRIRDIRIADPLLAPGQSGGGAGGSGNIEIADVNGLETALELRSRKAAIFTGQRVPFINEDGELESIAGDPEHCVKVDGTAGPCGNTINSYLAGTFVDGEIPAGTVNGSNSTFTLTQAPNPVSSLLVYRNGLLQKQSFDYSLTGSTIQFVPGAIPDSGDVLLASYRTTGTSSTIPQIVCASTGNPTGQTTPTSLGTCTIPATLLRAGDRLEIIADYSHEGALSGHSLQVLWGGTTVLNQLVGASTSAASVRASLGFHATGAQFSVQAFGANFPMVSTAGAANENLTAPITVDFRAWLETPSTDTVTLRNFTVVRHAAP